MAASSSQSSLPQGFSVYQPALGAQLQFFPAVGSKQLDDLINVYIPGPAAVSEKRANVSVDFLEYAQLTGQTFKFYPVYTAASVAASPVPASPSLDSASSSLNVSPVTSSWDWSATASVSSRSSTQRRRHSKATSPSSRHRTVTDFSNLPGMKILTKDGVDVTNSASRGSKTKEQRDHAHLMRIIKACDSCKRKKIRCDPSHKKRPAVQASSQPATSGATGPRLSKKQRTLPQAQPPPAQIHSSIRPSEVAVDEFASFSTSFDLGSSFDFSGLDALNAAALPSDPWEEFVQFPPMDVTEDYDFFLDPDNLFSSQSSAASSSASPSKALTPLSQGESIAPPGLDNGCDEILQTRSPQYPFLDQSGSSSSDYADFNLFSPQSSFSEDDRMLRIGSSSSSLPSLDEPLVSEYAPQGYDVLGGGDVAADSWDAAIASVEAPQLSSGDEVGGVAYYDPGLHGYEPSDRVNSSGGGETSVPAASLSGRQVVICCAPGTVVLTPEGPGSGILENVTTSLNASGSDLTRSAASEPPAHLDSQLGRITARAESRSESPAVPVPDYLATAITSAHRHDQSSVNALYQKEDRVQPASHISEPAPSNGAESGRQESAIGGEPAVRSLVSATDDERIAVSHVTRRSESPVEMPVAESPGLPSSCRREARNVVLTPIENLQTRPLNAVDCLGGQNRSAPQEPVQRTMPSTVASPSDGAVGLNVLPSEHCATSSSIRSHMHSSDTSGLRTVPIDSSLGASLPSAVFDQDVNAAQSYGRSDRSVSGTQSYGRSDQAVSGTQSYGRSAPCGLLWTSIATVVLSVLVLYLHGALISSSTYAYAPSTYLFGAMLAFTSKATARGPAPPATTSSRQTKQQSPWTKSNSSRFSAASTSTYSLPGKALAAVRSRVSRSIPDGVVGAFSVRASLQS